MVFIYTNQIYDWTQSRTDFRLYDILLAALTTLAEHWTLANDSHVQ